ncbi:MAG: ribulose 1,5-bisphosphate carboxylase large subunit [Actinobacteria bacterium]|nr:ribulose 1,5-bisphosphate carboxylase large subunit [Actinomycetota bacterium]
MKGHHTPVSPLSPVRLALSGERFGAVYALVGDRESVRRVADQLVVEQTIEFPRDLVPDDDIQREVIAHIERLDEVGDGAFELEVSFAVELAGGLLSQLLNVLFGNISMVAGVRLVDVALPASLLANFAGPRNGIEGLRRLFDRETGPLLATALKPMGTPVGDLAGFAFDLAANGIDLIKEDHSFATQPFLPFADRVPVLAEAVRRGADVRGAPAVFLPALNVAHEDVESSIDLCIEAGAGGVLVLPGLGGHDTMRWIAGNTPDDFVIQAHPAFLGSFVTSPDSGIAHEVLFGVFPRLAGADMSIFPNFGGRFSFSRDACSRIAERCRSPLGNLRAVWPAPAGGMSVEKVGATLEFYGPDTTLLIGGELYRGSIEEQVKRMVDAALEGQ